MSGRLKWLATGSIALMGLVAHRLDAKPVWMSGASQDAAPAVSLGGALPAPLPLFPSSNWWNLDISAAPVDPKSAAFISFIGPTRSLHPDFGGTESPGSDQIYGIPYIVVDGTQPKRTVQFEYSDESDGVNHVTNTSFPFYPIPDEAITQRYFIEGGPAGNQNVGGDRHVLIVDRDNKHLYELWNTYHDGSTWRAGSGAFFDLKTNDRRPDTWTSADASGMAILPGLVRYDEVYGPEEIRHAFRVTLRASNGYVYPASHSAGSNPSALPMGARLRLKASKDISSFPAPMQKIFRAMKTYGLIMADNGSDMYISGTFNTLWDNDVLNPAFGALKASDFEVVQLGYVPALPMISIADGAANEGDSGTSTLSFTVTLSAASASAITVQYATADSADTYPANSGADYTAASGTLTFAAGETSKVVAVTITGDTRFEPNETFVVNLSNVSSGATISDNQGKGTITNDDSRQQSVYQAFFAVDTLETPYVGDFNGDNKTDIITFTRQNPSAIGDVYVALSTGASFGANTKWHDFFAITTDETVVIGDYDGDNKDDIATWLGKTSRQVYVAKSLGTGMAVSTVWVNSIGSQSTDSLASGDANGDGKDDLIMFARTEGKVYVAISDGAKFGTPTVWHPFFAVSTYERPRVADVNGDGKADIVTFATDSPTAFGDVYIAVSNGTSFRDGSGGQNSDKWHDFFAIRPTEEIRVGDINADSKTDFFTFLPAPFAQCYTVLSQGTSMASNVLWPQEIGGLNTDKVFTGDVNGDGKADIIIFAQGEGKVYVSLGA